MSRIELNLISFRTTLAGVVIAKKVKSNENSASKFYTSWNAIPVVFHFDFYYFYI